MPIAKNRVFCPACGLNVEPALGMEGGYRTVSCSMCDLLLESKPLDGAAPPPVVAPAATPAAPPPPWQSAPPQSAPPPIPAPPPATTTGLTAANVALETVMAAEDTEGIRKMLVRLLTERGIARRVIAAANGEELLVQYHQALAAGRPVNLMILDVNMPILNGVNAAIGVRAAEKALGLATPTPILFFTSAQCDESFKRVLQFTAPARYLNKGAEGTPEQFAERLVAVLTRLLFPNAAAPAAPAG